MADQNESAQATQTAAPAQPTSASEGAAPASVPMMLTQEAPETHDEIMDISGAPPELQKWAKGFQGSFTKKSQELSEKMRALDERARSFDERERLYQDVLQRLAPAQPGQPNIVDQVKALREEGRHDEADQLVMQQQAAQLEPIKNQLAQEQMRARLAQVYAKTVAEDPLVAAYKGDVEKTFAQETPQMQLLKSFIFRDPDTMATLLPAVTRSLAIEAHARGLEKANRDLAKRLGEYEAAKAKAQGVPGRLIESGSTTKETTPTRMSLTEAYNRAVQEVSSGS